MIKIHTSVIQNLLINAVLERVSANVIGELNGQSVFKTMLINGFISTTVLETLVFNHSFGQEKESVFVLVELCTQS